MSRFGHTDVNIIAAIADLKDVDYQHILALAALVEVLIDKGVITREEIARKAAALDEPFPLRAKSFMTVDKQASLSDRM